MNKIIIWYNRNRKSIWKMIGIFVLVVLLVQLLKFIWKQRQIAESQVRVLPKNEVEFNLNSSTLEENKSMVTGEKIQQGQTSTLEVLDSFINYCNNGKINEAYSLLSEECKAEMYPTVQNFKNNYYNTVFAGKKKNVSLENWVGNIYKVKYVEDALATGVYKEGNAIQDYITLKADKEGNIKLNINKYIGKQKIDASTEVYGIQAKVIEKDMYMDYEVYTFEITNNSNSPILLNDINSLDCMYLEDTNNIKCNAYMHELSEAELKISLKETKRIKIKYYNKYSASREIKNIVFSKVILKYNVYSNLRNLGYYKDYGMIQISL